MPFFINPNNPLQPSGGVYRWLLTRIDGSELTLYVGKSTVSTLKRGIDQINKTPKHHNKNGIVYFDTNYILGDIIESIEAKCKSTCYWEHVCNDPTKEIDCANYYKPYMQVIKGKTLLIKSSIVDYLNIGNHPSTCQETKILIGEEFYLGNYKHDDVGEFFCKCEK